MTATAQLLVWRKNSPVLVVALVVLGLASVGEGWLIFAHRRMALRAEAQLVRHVHELRNLLATTPAATNETATAIAADRARVARLLSAWQNAVRGQSPAAEAMRATRVPAKRTEAFFDLATFVEKTREEAARLDVRLRPDERFSFSAYAHQGPNPESDPGGFPPARAAPASPGRLARGSSPGSVGISARTTATSRGTSRAAGRFRASSRSRGIEAGQQAVDRGFLCARSTALAAQPANSREPGLPPFLYRFDRDAPRLFKQARRLRSADSYPGYRSRTGEAGRGGPALNPGSFAYQPHPRPSCSRAMSPNQRYRWSPGCSLNSR